MFRDHDEFNAVIDAEHAKMRDLLATASAETVDSLMLDDARGTLYGMIRDVEAIAQACVRHPAIVGSEDSFRYTMIILLASRSLLIAENKSYSDSLFE